MKNTTGESGPVIIQENSCRQPGLLPGAPREGRALKDPGRLFGREKPTIDMLSAFRRVCRGAGEILLVPGHSGVGKTSLVQALQDPVESLNGCFVQGKNNQYQQNTPYFALRAALASLWAQMQKGHSHQLSRLHDEIKGKVGNLGGLLVELVPDLQVLWPETSEVQVTNPQEARLRFARAIQLFLEVACRPNHPVVMFLDDWQWADPASLDFLRQLPIGSDLRYFLLVVAYRDDEVGPTHPLAMTLAELSRQGAPARAIQVENLSLENVWDFIAATFGEPVQPLEELTSLVHRHTAGNPFFVGSFLHFLVDEGHLVFRAEAESWCWVEDRGDLPGNIVALFERVVRRFDGGTQHLLALGACLGNRFNLDRVPMLSGWSEEECVLGLEPALDAGLLVRESGPLREAGQWCRFLHDRVQEAAFRLIPDSEMARIQLDLGRRLLAGADHEPSVAELYEILEHLNQGLSLIAAEPELETLVELNLEAAEHARKATAYGSMLGFCRMAKACAERWPGGLAGFWRGHHDKALSMCRGLAESEFLEGDVAQAEKVILDSLPLTHSARERARTLTLLIVNFTLSARYAEAISAGRKALSELGIVLPRADYADASRQEIAEIREALGGGSPLDLAAAPLMVDEDMQVATRVLITMGPPCYRTHQRLWSVLVPKVVNLTLRHGLMPEVGYSHTALGGLLTWLENDLATAQEFGELATRVMRERFENPAAQSVFYLMLGSSTTHWFNHPRQASLHYQQAYEIGARSGNLQYAAYAFGHDMYCCFFRGVPLGDLIRQTEQSLVFSRTRKNQWAIDLLEGGLRVFRQLAGEDEAPDGEAAYLDQVKSHGNIQVRCIYQVLRTYQFLMSGRLDLARQASDAAEELSETVGTQGLLPWPEHVFLRALVQVIQVQGEGAEARAVIRPDLERAHDLLRSWSEHNPDHYRHKCLLLEAQLARLDGENETAAMLFDQAVEQAKAGGYGHWEGLTHQLAADFWEAQEHQSMTQVHWQQAHGAYRRWGALSQVDHVENRMSRHLVNRLMAGKGGDEVAWGGDMAAQVAENYLAMVRRQSRDHLDAQRGKAATGEVEELARATEKLRREVAERRKAEETNLQLEAQLRQSHKMQAVGTLAGGIAHEFNNLLAVVMGCSDLIALDLEEDCPARESLENIQQASSRMRDLVQKILTFSRTDQADREPCELSTLVAEALSLVKPSLPTSVELRSSLDSGDARILAHKTDIQQIIMNLCSNGVWAMQDKGVLTIQLETAGLSTERGLTSGSIAPGNYGLLRVRDTGCGMDPALVGRIFEPFFTCKEVGEGTGLGMAIVYGLMESYGGGIDVQTRPGEGTSFQLYFPLTREKVRAKVQPREDIPGGQERILLVDDEEMVARPTAKLLSRLGYEVEFKTCSREALKAFAADPQGYDLVITDQAMPGLNGEDLLQEMLSRRPDLPVIICTGYSAIMNEDRARGLAARALLQKPIATSRLARVIRDVLDRGPMPAPPER